jgi:hypothetical protein
MLKDLVVWRKLHTFAPSNQKRKRNMEKNAFLEMYNDALSQQVQGITIRTDIAEGHHLSKGVEYVKEYCGLSHEGYSLEIKQYYIGIGNSSNKRTILIPYDRIVSVELWG